MENYWVISMHRSGSSLISGLMHNSGIDMGEGHFGNAGEDNPRGYFEDRRFRKINDIILSHNRYDVKSWKPDIPTMVATKRLYEQIRGIRDGVMSRGKWGMKDPRFCLTWHIWRRYLPKETTVVYVYRNPVSVANSLMKRGNVGTLEEGLVLWNIYNQRALPVRKHFKTVFVEYEDVLANGRINKLQIDDTTNLIDTSLYHHEPAKIPDLNENIWRTLKLSEKG